MIGDRRGTGPLGGGADRALANLGGDQAGVDRAGPAAIALAVGDEADPRLLAGPGDADVGEAAFLLQALFALLVHAALGGEDAFLPARQEDQREFQPLGRVQGHDLHRVRLRSAVEVHDQGDVLQIGFERLEVPHRLDQFLEVLQPGLGGRALVEAEGVGIAALLQHLLHQARMGEASGLVAPAIHVAQEVGQRGPGARGQFVCADHLAGRLQG